MWKNYLKIARRNLLKHKSFSAINILGLSVGLACCILLLLFVQHEVSYDRHHENAEQIHRFVGGGWAAVSPRIGPTLANDFPNLIEDAVRLYPLRTEQRIQVDESVFMESNLTFADSTYFRMFTHTMIQGNPETALDRPRTVVLTESTARKYFGEKIALGQTIHLFDQQVPFEVTGIIEDLPVASHYPFDLLASFSSLRPMLGERLQLWQWGALYTYLQLYPGVHPDQLTSQLDAFWERHLGEAWNYGSLQPLLDIHLDASLEKDFGPRGNVVYIYLLTTIAIFVLLVACVNFMNLTTARATDRAKEVGMRKALGAHRSQLIRQFLGESILLSLLSLGLALLLVEATLPLFNAVTGKQLAVDYLDNLPALLTFLGLSLGVGMLGGLYPAFVLSRFTPVRVLRNNQSPSAMGARLRRMLVVTQFTISTALVIAAVIVYQQLDYMQNRGLGFDKDQVVFFETRNYGLWKEALQGTSGVAEASGAFHVPGQRFGMYEIRMEGMPADSMAGIRANLIDYDYIKTLDIDLVAGRDFSEEITTDAREGFILNEAAVAYFQEAYGITGDFVGREVTWTWGGERTGQVIGVTKDFNYASLHTEVEPLVLLYTPQPFRALVRLSQGQIEHSLGELERIWSDVEQDRPFQVTFLDDQLNSLYSAEQQLSSVFGAFTGLAIFIACLGLFGLATFTIEKRRKEIGVRKVLGASVSGIVVLLTKDVARLVVYAILIAAPIAYLAANRWLDDFAYRVDISGSVFLVAGLAALGIAVLTVSYHSIKAALTDPVKSIRYE